MVLSSIVRFPCPAKLTFTVYDIIIKARIEIESRMHVQV